ncbi:putative TIM-barrel fold metal-dependent hydrolase [Saccharomonospora marina XMU15]|uniref:Putative TIM-barrel fold metal-dependent hydrolase n=1 Tax=Saccharomonospora marina XMU15 TaxID=882083 RepID=H5X103_9PSEU|nr:amidohydrolase [Saccharomonospora marina]EHR53062.1 putative TIM-barrel fold metal-dependent hydrolase [Saccharomonospora marina XMU15]
MLDLLLRDVHALTMTERRPVAHAVGVFDGRIVGLDEQVADLPARRVVSGGGAVLTPGFADAHNHMVWYGLSLAELDLSACTSLEQVYDLVARRAAALPSDGWVIGSGYDDFVLGGHPSRAALDNSGGGRAVWLKHRSAHMCVVSSAILAETGVLDGTATVPEAGVVGRDESGEPTGLLAEQAQQLVDGLVKPYPVEELAAAVARAARRYVAEGLTHVTEAGVGGGWIGHSPAEVSAYQLARQRGELSLRVELMPASEVLHPLPGDTVGLDLGLRPGFGDDLLRIGPMKIFTDGALSSRTAAVTEPFIGHGGLGVLGDDPEVLRSRMLAAHRSGWRIAAHAIGDRAIDLTLDTLEEAQRALPRPGVRHRIEHAGMVRPDQLPRMARLGVVPVPQARFLHEIGDTMAESVGPQRVPWLYRHRSFLEAGLRVPGSSDRPCVGTGAPLSGMRSMVERRTKAGIELGAQERVGAKEALRAYTTHAAYASHQEHRRGKLARGTLADLVLLAEDPTTVASSKLADIEVLATFVAGELVHGTLPGL